MSRMCAGTGDGDATKTCGRSQVPSALDDADVDKARLEVRPGGKNMDEDDAELQRTDSEASLIVVGKEDAPVQPCENDGCTSKVRDPWACVRVDSTQRSHG